MEQSDGSETPPSPSLLSRSIATFRGFTLGTKQTRYIHLPDEIAYLFLSELVAEHLDDILTTGPFATISEPSSRRKRFKRKMDNPISRLRRTCRQWNDVVASVLYTLFSDMEGDNSSSAPYCSRGTPRLIDSQQGQVYSPAMSS
jgi:hypothetical protein